VINIIKAVFKKITKLDESILEINNKMIKRSERNIYCRTLP